MHNSARAVDLDESLMDDPLDVLERAVRDLELSRSAIPPRDRQPAVFSLCGRMISVIVELCNR